MITYIPIKTMTGKQVYINQAFICSIEEVTPNQICIIMKNKEYYNTEMTIDEFKQVAYQKYLEI